MLPDLSINTASLSVDELELLQKGNICISIIVPTHRLSPERRADRTEVESAVDKAKKYLELNYSKDEIKRLLLSLDHLMEQLDFTHNAEGIGLFVSELIQKRIIFYFPVKEKIMVSDSFEVRDLLYQLYYTRPYRLLLLSEKGVKLYNGKSDKLEEVRDQNFPKKHEEEYEYNPPSRGSSYVGYANTKDFERDKSKLEEIRYKEFLQQVDNALNDYVDGWPVIVAGPKKDVAYFRIITKQPHLAGNIYGNYHHAPLKELADLGWQAMKLYLYQNKQRILEELNEQIGQGNAVQGIAETWKAANEGRGMTLLAEKDYTVPGFTIQGDDNYTLHLHSPKEKHRVIPDAVNAIIETVLEKNGDIIMMENDSLPDFQHIALITRY